MSTLMYHRQQTWLYSEKGEQKLFDPQAKKITPLTEQEGVVFLFNKYWILQTKAKLPIVFLYERSVILLSCFSPLCICAHLKKIDVPGSLLGATSRHDAKDCVLPRNLGLLVNCNNLDFFLLGRNWETYYMWVWIFQKYFFCKMYRMKIHIWDKYLNSQKACNIGFL